MILTDLRKHDDLNGEVGFIVFKPDDRFDGPSGTASSCATTRTSSSPRDQTCSSTRTHLAPRAASPARPPLSNSSLRPPRRPRRTVDDHPIQSLLDCFKQKLGLTASMCHSVLAQALSESMMQQARTRPRPAPDGLPVSAGEPPCRKRREHHLPPLAPRKPVTGLPPPHREPSAQILDAASFDHESDSAVVELAKIPDEQALVRPNSNAAVVDASPLSFKNPVPDRCTAPGEPLPLEAHILPVKIKRKVSLLLDEGLLSWQDVLEVRQGDATPRPRRARSSPARSLGPRCFHANLDSRRAPPPASSSPPLRPHATLTLTPPRRRPSATSSSSSRRAPSLARARLAACSPPHHAARDTLARHAAQLASCTARRAAIPYGQ